MATLLLTLVAVAAYMTATGERLRTELEKDVSFTDALRNERLDEAALAPAAVDGAVVHNASARALDRLGAVKN